MSFNPETFNKTNVVDTCTVWNILSSELLFGTAISAGVSLSCTGFVYYECMIKPRKTFYGNDRKLQGKFYNESKKKNFRVCHLDIEDLQEIDVLEKRRNLGKGELSSIAFAKRTGQAVMTDDQKARRLAESVMSKSHVQTTPYLFGWLIYHNYLYDHDKQEVIKQHKSFNRPLEIYFEEIYLQALNFKLMAK